MIKLSVIIATYNRAPHLRRALESLAGQTLAPERFEIVVVDNNSSDDTPEVCGRFAADYPWLNFMMVAEARQGVSHARNAGITNSRGEYLAFIDDDEEVNTGFAESYYRFFESHPEATVAGGEIVPLYEYTPPEWLSGYTERPIAGTLRLGGKIREFPRNRFPGGGNMGVRRMVFERYGMFDPGLGRTGISLLAAEEKELIHRFRAGGEKVFYLPEAKVLHIIPKEKLSKEYFDKVTRMIGVSERIRTEAKSDRAYRHRLVLELIKWEATFFLSTWYLLTFRPAKGRYLCRMRWNITEGLLDI